MTNFDKDTIIPILFQLLNTIALIALIIFIIYIIIHCIKNKKNKTFDFLEFSKKRHSVREYSYKKVPDKLLQSILEAGRVAPSARNLQPHLIYVFESDDARERLSNACNFHNAPLVLMVAVDNEKAWKNRYSGKSSACIDASIVTTQMMNEANSLGLSTVWICGFNEEALISEFSLPKNVTPVNVLAIGYPSKKEDLSNRYDEERAPLHTKVKYL